MEKREVYERKETWNMALICLTIPLSVIALAFAKKTKPKPCPCSDNKKTGNARIDNINKPLSSDQVYAEYRAADCWGTAKLFEEKRKKIMCLSKLTKYVGLFIPISLGLFISLKNSSFIAKLIPTLIPELTSISEFVAIILNLVLLYFSLRALIDNWDIKLENYTKSISNNKKYYKDFMEVRHRYNENETKYANLYTETKSLDDVQQEKDGKENYSIEDRQFIARHGLNRIGAKCKECKKIPDIIEKSKKCKCSICGT